MTSFQRLLDVYATSVTLHRRLIDVETMSSVYWVGILLSPTDLLESNEDLSVGFIKKEIFDLFLRKLEKCLCENEMLSFVLPAIEEN